MPLSNASRGFIAVLLVILFAPSAWAQLVETEIPRVSAELIELRQQGGVLRLAVRLVNDSASASTPGDLLHLSQLVLIDAKSKAKHFAIKGSDGHILGGPTTDWNTGGRWLIHIPAKSQLVLWALFEPLPSGSTVSVQVPKMFPFDDVKVAEGPGKPLSSGATTSEIAGSTATLVSARRADQQLTVRLRVVAGPTRQYAPHILYQDVFFFDPLMKRKYPVLKDTAGNFQAQPVSDASSGGRFWVSLMAGGGVALMSLTMQAPPDTVVSGDLLLPGFLPIEGFAIAGTGGAAAGGTAVSGQSLGIEGALKDLNASVTPAGIAINLSADVLFDVDKSDLKATAEAGLQKLLTVVNGKATSTVSVVGHTDTRGEAAYNQALSERRANAVKAWLVANGVPATRVNASGAGESRPRASADTDEAHRANRRVEIEIK